MQGSLLYSATYSLCADD